MRLTEYFLETKKETPSDASLISHKLMIRSSMIKQTSAGIYAWLPLGLRVLKKIENIIRDIQNLYGCQEILMPTIQQSDLWKKSGRYDDYGPEMLKFLDRNEKELLYGPTNEELITFIFKDYIKSYKNLPKNLYQIQWKFRDEIRPRFGVMRCREFLMKDNYSFDLTIEDAKKSYNNMFKCYLDTFCKMGLRAIPVQADSGAIGGDMSHEFHIINKSGDTELIYDKKIDDLRNLTTDASYKILRNLYAVTNEKYNETECKLKKNDLIFTKGIEVGHIFFFGTKYTQSMQAYVLNKDGKKINVQMGSYGIGISRLVAAIIESSHDQNGIIWPKEVAPFNIGLINLNIKDKKLNKISENLYKILKKHHKEVIYDDTNESPGNKFANMDLIGIPYQLIVGSKSIKNNELELKERKTNKIKKLNLNNVNQLLNQLDL